MLYCEKVSLYPISDDVRCVDCPEFEICPVVHDVYEELLTDDYSIE